MAFIYKRCPISIRKIFLLLTSTTCTLVISLIAYQRSANPGSFSLRRTYDNAADFIYGDAVGADESSNHSFSCTIPQIYPDPEWLSKNAGWLSRKVSALSCEHHRPNVVTIDNGDVIVSTTGNTLCRYSVISRVDDFNVSTDPIFHELPAGRRRCPGEVFRVMCYNPSFDLLMRCIYKKPQVDARISSITHQKKRPPGRFQDSLNILIIGLDSLSHVAWLEQMKETNDVMTNILGSIIFDGYNIVGDGTTAAILGLTTGFYEDELYEARRGFKGAKTVDEFPFIWRQLAAEAGYVNLLDEDCPETGIFQYRLLGFQDPPVDYYGRSFHLAMNYPDDACLGSQSTFEEMISLFGHLSTVYPDPVRKFAFLFNGYFTHSARNTGSNDGYKVDHALADKLKLLNNEGYLNQTLLILLADHGPRFSLARATDRGKIAERLPYLAMAFPKWFQEKYPRDIANVKAAAKRLITPFDIHATLLDVGGLKPNVKLPPKRGLSLFLPIPSNRTCTDAGIAPHWCTCLSRNANFEGKTTSELPLNDSLVTRCLREFEHFVNGNLLASLIANRKCDALKAEEPFQVKKLVLSQAVSTFVATIGGHGRIPEFDRQEKAKEEYLQLSFRTNPGGGQWEVTFIHNLVDDDVFVSWKQISRTNQYGTAANCIASSYPHLRQFCFCTSNSGILLQ